MAEWGAQRLIFSPEDGSCVTVFGGACCRIAVVLSTAGELPKASKQTRGGHKQAAKKDTKKTKQKVAAKASAKRTPKKAPKQTTRKAPAGKGKTVAKTATKARMSGLDAAAKVLGETGQPMSCREMVEKMLAQKYWSTNGKTPANTLYSAILRQINTKPKESQFKKVGRGKFALRK